MHLITSPWWYTDSVMRKYLAYAIPYIKGKVLDVGCGKKKYEDMFKVDIYIGVEIDIRFEPDVVVGKNNLLPFKDNALDSVLLLQVLEHVPNISLFLKEIVRVLNPGGHLVVSVPFVSRIHVADDFLRFTEYGIKNYLQEQNLPIIKIIPMGGFLNTQYILWIFYFYDSINGFKNKFFKKIIGSFLRIFLFFANPLALALHRFDNNLSLPFNYLVIVKKTK